jgi:hypothetical protein
VFCCSVLVLLIMISSSELIMCRLYGAISGYLKKWLFYEASLNIRNICEKIRNLPTSKITLFTTLGILIVS